MKKYTVLKGALVITLPEIQKKKMEVKRALEYYIEYCYAKLDIIEGLKEKYLELINLESAILKYIND